MSGIAGIFYRDGRPVQLEQLELMSKALAHRGMDGISYYCHESIGMVHCMLHDTPESLLETLPHAIDGGRLVITFHGRIDNREELKKLLGWEKLLSESTDSDFILAAYEKWGKTCPENFLGDFAFAIWDDRAQKLFCARDHMGVKPYYYYSDDAKFVFASEIKGLLALSEVPRVLNEERIADYLTSIVLDNESTFYDSIYRLSPGHSIEIERDKSRRTRYHEFIPSNIYYTTDREYEDQFRRIFAEAVRCRLRSVFPIGSYLSGGLDSASIVCTAVEMFADELPNNFHTFSGVFDEISKCDERKYFFPIVERYGIISHQLPTDKINPAIAYEKLIQDEDEPFLSPHIFMSMSLLDMMKSKRMRIVLDGHDGDAAVSYGYNLLAELAHSWKISQLVECYRQSGFKSKASIMKRLLSLYWDIYCNKVPAAFYWSRARKEIAQSAKLLNPDFAKRTGIIERLIDTYETLPMFGQSEREFHEKNISQPIQSYALELFERVAIRGEVVSRYPFFDKKVIEFCLGLPACQKYKEGLNRSIVRRSLADILPNEILQRKTKTDFTPSLLNAFQKNDHGWLLSNIDSLDKSIYAYISEKYLSLSLVKYKKKHNALRILAQRDLLSVVILSKWMRGKSQENN